MKRGKQGSLLIVILWILAILSLLGVSMSYQTALDIYSTRASNARIKATYLTRAAVAQAITVLKKDLSLDQDTLTDIWANNPYEFEEKSIGINSFSIVYEENGEKRFGLIDEERKINLNTAPQEVLENLFRELEIDRDLVATLMDWIDEDSDDRNHGSGAEEDYYDSLTPSYLPKNDAIETLEELYLIKDFDPVIVEKLKDHVTVFGSGKINVNTATPQTWKALGFSESFVEKIERFRLGRDGEWNTEDDGVITTRTNLLTELEKSESLLGQERFLLNKFQNYFRVTSIAFTVKAKVFSYLHIEKEVTAVLSLEEGKDVQIIYWHEN